MLAEFCLGFGVVTVAINTLAVALVPNPSPVQFGLIGVGAVALFVALVSWEAR